MVYYFHVRDGVLIVLILTRVHFSVLSCTLYLAKFMSTCTHTYLSTVTKKNCTHEYITSTTEYFFKFQSDREKKLIVSQALPHLFQMPIRFEKKWPHLCLKIKKIYI